MASLRDNTLVNEFSGRGTPSIRKPSVSLREKIIGAICGVLLAFQAWSIGSMWVTPQWINAFLVIIAFILLWIPFPRERTSRTVFQNFVNLIKFPGFWFGSLFMGYIWLQAINPSHLKIYGSNYGSAIREIEHMESLPTSIAANFSDMNAWRVFLIMGTAWLFLCVLYVGITRRRTVMFILLSAVASASLMGLAGIFFKMIGSDALLGLYEVSNKRFFGSFIYPNHAAAFFYLALCLAIGIVLQLLQKSFRNPSARWLIIALFVGIASIAAAMVVTYSRYAIFSMITILALSTPIILFLIWKTGAQMRIVFMISCMVIATGITIFAIASSDHDYLQKRVGNLNDEIINFQNSTRTYVAKATYDMFSDNPWTGWGAGSFRHYFPIYQIEYQEIMVKDPNNFDKVQKRLGWSHAHNDYYQFLAEYGIIGTSFIVLTLLYMMLHSFLYVDHWHWLNVYAWLGVAIMLLHSWVDFPSYSPAVQLLFLFALVVAARYPEICKRVGAK